MEKTHQFQPAVSGYRTDLTRWPQSLAARMGMDNSYYALGDFRNAEHAFRGIIRLHPRAGAAYNYLAQILMELGRYPEALEMARKAVFL